MKAKWIHGFATGASLYGKKWHHGVKRKGIWEEVLAAGVEVNAGNGRGIEW
jgi:hypothetical protein